MPIKLALTEVVLRTTDLAPMTAFYDSLLDGPRVRELSPLHPPSRQRNADTPQRMRFIPLDPQRSFGGDMLAIFECPGEGGAGRPSTTGMHHFQMRLESLPMLFAAYVRMKAAGHLPATAQNHGLGTSFYYLDPDGNRVELNARNFGSVEEEETFAATPEFAANPAGHAIDVEAILALHAAGRPLLDLIWEKR
jgi:catechol 2,3-dioxygenase-like lactoylglutathione lyase family enzyme